MPVGELVTAGYVMSFMLVRILLLLYHHSPLSSALSFLTTDAVSVLYKSLVFRLFTPKFLKFNSTSSIHLNLVFFLLPPRLPSGNLRLIVQPCEEDDQLFSFLQVFENRWNEIDMGKPKYSGEKPVPVALCPPQIPHGLSRDRNRASAVRGRLLTA
jgi:hypothetical protein